MNTKKIMKVISVLFVIFAILSVVNMVMGAQIGAQITDIKPTAPDGGSQVTTITNRIIYIIQMICYAAAFIMLLVLGIKFISASPDGKAEIKKSAVMYVIGALLVFGAGALLGVISNLTAGVVKPS